MEEKYTILKNRSIIKISGDDKYNFLQSIITKNIFDIDKNQIIFALLLSPQGKYLFEFFIYKVNDDFLIEINSAKIETFLKKLKLYKLRAKVNIEDISSEFEVVYNSEGKGFKDPRFSKIGYRYLAKKGEVIDGDEDFYEKDLIKYGIADDIMIEDKSFPLEFGMEILNAIDFDKGCYVGQEVTARTKYRGVVRKKIYKFYGEKPEIERIVYYKDQLGLALMKEEELQAFELNRFILADYYL